MELEVVAMRTMLRLMFGCAVGFAVSTLANEASAQTQVSRPSIQRPRIVRPQIQRPGRVSVTVQHPQTATVFVQRVQSPTVNVSRPNATRPSVNRVRGVTIQSKMSAGTTRTDYAPQGTISGGSTERLIQPIQDMTIAAVEAPKPLVYPRTQTIELWTTPAPRVDEEADVEEFVD
jgi:hypothetical protein